MDPAWEKSFTAFKKYINTLPRPEGSRLVLINPAGHYAPGNVHWAAPSNILTIEYNGTTQSASAWANAYGIPASTLINRVKRGWDIDRALSTPVNGYSKSK
jgi:hypothetical protein